MSEMIFCQSCGMPLQKEEDYGTNNDGSKNREYCVHCYKDGAFTQDVTMEAMIEICVPFMTDMKPEEAKAMLKEHLPKLKRWQ